MQKHVFERMDEERLTVYVVWGPMLGPETRPDAVKATAYLEDPRSLHFWTDEDRIAERFRAVTGLPEGELAWDTFLLYPPGVRWDGPDGPGGTPPVPAVVMHVNKPLPDEQKLDAHALRDRVREVLADRARPAG